MLQSMTAFGRRTVEIGTRRFAWEFRSVNHRYLEVQVRLPEHWRELEPGLRRRLQGRVHRGKVDIGLRVLSEPSAVLGFRPDAAELDAFADALALVRARLPDATVDALAVLQTLDARTRDASADDGSQSTPLLRGFDAALDDFIATRTREGAAIASMLQARATEVERTVERIASGRDAVRRRQRTRLLERLAHLDVMHDGSRLEQEMAVAAQRLDVDEELDRLRQHLRELAAVLVREEPVGRRLDFLMQEFNREANTLGAKAADTEAVHAVVDLKVCIEQMREQVQNVE